MGIDKDILAIQEKYLRGSDVTEIWDYLLFTSGAQNRKLGTDFLINKVLQKTVKNSQLYQNEYSSNKS